VDIEDLLKNTAQFVDDFLLFLGRERGPDLARGDFLGDFLACEGFLTLGHDSYSFTRASNSRAADRHSLSRGVSRPKLKRLVARRGKRSTIPSR
jgi:hypothetical protein